MHLQKTPGRTAFSQHYDDPLGTLSIVSSDERVSRVSQVKLRAASGVFDEMLNCDVYWVDGSSGGGGLPTVRVGETAEIMGLLLNCLMDDLPTQQKYDVDTVERSVPHTHTLPSAVASSLLRGLTSIVVELQSARLTRQVPLSSNHGRDHVQPGAERSEVHRSYGLHSSDHLRPSTGGEKRSCPRLSVLPSDSPSHCFGPTSLLSAFSFPDDP